MTRRFEIHPGIGIARLGNADHEHYYISPEVPDGWPTEADGAPVSELTRSGKIRRAAARFRIYEYDGAGKVIRELGLHDEDVVSIEWNVRLVNSKAAWYRHQGDYSIEKSLRNDDVEGHGKNKEDAGYWNSGDRKDLVIDSSQLLSIGEKVPSSAKLAGHIGEGKGRVGVTLGHLVADLDRGRATGRLLVVGSEGMTDRFGIGHKPGSAGSIDPKDRDAELWFDDVSDGPVQATVTIRDESGREIQAPATPAWVIVAPPKFAPGANAVVTALDRIRSARDPEGKAEPFTFYRDLYPVYVHLRSNVPVSAIAAKGHASGNGRINPNGEDWYEWAMANAGHMAEYLSSPPNEGVSVYALSQPPEERDGDYNVQAVEHLDAPSRVQLLIAQKGRMPALYADNNDGWSTLTPRQYQAAQRAAAGSLVRGDEPLPPSHGLSQRPLDAQPAALDEAGLTESVGAGSDPGIEAPWQVIGVSACFLPGQLRFDPDQVEPGAVTKWMAMPWQNDFAACNDKGHGAGWWPSSRPDPPESAEQYDDWYGYTMLNRTPHNEPRSPKEAAKAITAWTTLPFFGEPGSSKG